MTHTPGPWRAVRNEVHVGKRRICANVTAGESLGLGPELERAYENARLIAAAPRMLHELYAAAAQIEALGGDASTQRAAIAEATEEK